LVRSFPKAAEVFSECTSQQTVFHPLRRDHEDCRTQPGLPLKKGRCGTMTHDDKRNGATTLVAALDIAQGKVVG
jgi:hypothetical protein